MKQISIVILAVFAFNVVYSQEWMTSLELAKRLALVQNKMIFAVWQDATQYSYPIVIHDGNGNLTTKELFQNDTINEIVWKYFVPVKIQEYKFSDLLKESKGRKNPDYIKKLNDDSIKIMDANGNILNIFPSENVLADYSLSFYIRKYALNTSYIKPELVNYSKKRNFNTTYRLATKYLDYAILSNRALRKELVSLSDIYMNEANYYLNKEETENKEAFKQNMSLMEIKKYLILDDLKKVQKMLRKYEKEEIDDLNQSLFAFLNFASYRCLNDIEKAMDWQEKVSLVDLKKVKYLIN